MRERRRQRDVSGSWRTSGQRREIRLGDVAALEDLRDALHRVGNSRARSEGGRAARQAVSESRARVRDGQRSHISIEGSCSENVDRRQSSQEPAEEDFGSQLVWFTPTAVLNAAFQHRARAL